MAVGCALGRTRPASWSSLRRWLGLSRRKAAQRLELFREGVFDLEWDEVGERFVVVDEDGNDVGEINESDPKPPVG